MPDIKLRFESLKSISVLIHCDYKLMIGSCKNNRGNYPRKCFWTQEKETGVKFNPGLSANKPLNNWACRLLNAFTWTIWLKIAGVNKGWLPRVTEHVTWYVTNRVYNSQLTPHIYSELKRKTFSGSKDSQDLVVKCPLRLVAKSLLNIFRWGK